MIGKQNFVINYLRGVKISYDILTPGSSWDSFWKCQNESIITTQEIIDIILIQWWILSHNYETQIKLCHRGESKYHTIF